MNSTGYDNPHTMNPYFLKPIATATCCRCLFDDTIAVIDSDGICEYCHIHDRLEREADYNWDGKLMQIKKRGKGKKYDCLIGISGGLDSSTLLYMAVKLWKLKVLVIHFDNHYNTLEAEHNMKMLIQHLNVDSIRFTVNKEEYDQLNRAFLKSGTPDCDIPNDCAMGKLMNETAHRYGIKTILNGHDFRTEGSTPRMWTLIDSKYLQDVYARFNSGKKLQNFPLLTVMDQVRDGLCGISQVRPFHNYQVHIERDLWEEKMKEAIGFKWYGFKHGENTYTAFIGGFVLPKKFGIDKRIVYLSARVRSYLLTRERALKELMLPFEVGVPDTSMLSDISSEISSRDAYKKYNYKKYKYLIFMLCKIGIMPWTVWLKYCR